MKKKAKTVKKSLFLETCFQNQFGTFCKWISLTDYKKKKKKFDQTDSRSYSLFHRINWISFQTNLNVFTVPLGQEFLVLRESVLVTSAGADQKLDHQLF